MGKRIIQQARGHGSLTYRVRKKAFRFRIGYINEQGKGKIIKLMHSPGHSAPLMKIIVNGKTFYNPAFKNAFEGQEIEINNKHDIGNITQLKNVPVGNKVYNIENRYGDGGKMIRTSGNSAIITKKQAGKVGLLMPSKKEIFIDENSRCTVGEIAGGGRLEKPIIKAGKKYHMMKAKNKLWPRTSAVKMNAIDHPFGSGRGKRIKSKIAKRNAPPGKKVGLLSPRKTGRKKGI